MKQSKKHTVKIEDDGKLHHSQYLLTINSNNAVTSYNDPYVKTFKNKVMSFLKDIPNYVVVNPGAYPDDNMIFEIKPYIEIGENQHRVHAHLSILIQHNSNIKLDTQKISNDLDGYYVNVKYVKGSKDIDRILAYLRKQQ